MDKEMGVMGSGFGATCPLLALIPGPELERKEAALPSIRLGCAFPWWQLHL